METAIREPEKKEVTIASREQVLAALKVKHLTYQVAELGGLSITIRQVTSKDQHDIRSGATRSIGGPLDDAMFNALTLQRCIVEPEFKLEDVVELQRMSFVAVAAIAKKIWDFSGISNTEEAGKKD